MQRLPDQCGKYTAFQSETQSDKSQRSASVPCTLVSIPDITQKKSHFYESVGFGDTCRQILKFSYAALFPEDSSRFGSVLGNLWTLHKSLKCTKQGCSICLGFGPLIFWKNTRDEELPSRNRGIVVPPFHCFEFDYKFTLFRSAYIANAESFKVSSVDQELDPGAKNKIRLCKKYRKWHKA